MHVTSLVCDLGEEEQEQERGRINRRMSLPGIGTAFMPRGNHRGILSLTNLLLLGQHKTNSKAGVERADENSGAVADSPELVIAPEINSSPFEDCGSEQVINQGNELKKSKLVKTKSSVSLPAQPDDKANRARYLIRSQTRPELKKPKDSVAESADDQSLARLLVEAMLILHEADVTGTILDIDDVNQVN